jgi:Erythromycin esterase
MRNLAMLAALLPAALLAQTNLQFGQGVPLNPVPGWYVLDGSPDMNYSSEWHENCRGDAPCAELSAPSAATPSSLAKLLQDFKAVIYRGKHMKLRAWIKLDAGALTDRAQLLLQVNRPGAEAGFSDEVRVTSSEWKSYEIRGPVAADADTIRVGVTLFGKGRVWLSGVEFVEDGTAPPPKTEARPAAPPVPVPAAVPAPKATGAMSPADVREAIQKQYERLDAAFSRGDGAEVAKIVLADAQLRLATVNEPLLPAIQAEMLKGAKLTAKTKVVSAQMDGENAVVTVQREAADPNPAGKRRVVTVHRDTWGRVDDAWRWKESVEVSYHWVLPPTTVSIARLVALELKTQAKPLQSEKPGEEWGDLAAFGASVGQARIVALGEAARGTREFAALKLRLVEYLVKEKGFTVVAATNKDDAAGAAGWLASNAPKAVFVPLPTGDPTGMAKSFGELADTTYPAAKIILWTDNAHARFGDEMAEKSMGEWLRAKYGRKYYAAGFAFHRGEVRAVGVDQGDSKGLGMWTVPASPEGTGDAVLSAAGVPEFFLDLANVPASGVLARWLAEAHLFHEMGAYWVVQDPETSLQPAEVKKRFDGLFFIEELHAGA